MTKREFEQRQWQEKALANHGVTAEDVDKLRRISNTLRRWFEKECGIDGGCIERDEKTGKPYWLVARSGNRLPMRDLETRARYRLAKIMTNYPTLKWYIQADPRGAALYILRPGDVPKDCCADGYYTRGICVY